MNFPLNAVRELVSAARKDGKPVVRLTARHGVVGQLGTVGGVVAGSTPTSVSVAGEPAGSARHSARPARSAAAVRLISGIQHDSRADVAACASVRGP